MGLIEAADRARRSPVRHPQATDQNTVLGVADDSESPTPLTNDAEACTLVAAGWKPKIRFGRTIWERPDAGFWISQELALHLLEGRSTKEGQRS